MVHLAGYRVALALGVFAALFAALATATRRDQCPFERAYCGYIGAPGTGHNRRRNSRNFYFTNSGAPNLPRLGGFVGSHGTYRFLHVLKQTLVVIGEPKHGLWRIQENGFIREYRKNCLVGIRKALVDRWDINTQWDRIGARNRRIIRENYRPWIPEDGQDGYYGPEDRFGSGCQRYLNYIDLSIHHPKYGNKYENHPPIDLPIFYCIISQAGFPYLFETWKYITAQPLANKIGPLGVRAGLDIKEHYLNVVRFFLADDAGVWANVGTGNNETDFQRCDPNEEPPQTINYERVDLSKIDHELYVVERLMFNEPHLFIMLIMDGNDNGDPLYTYIRNDGGYWSHLVERGLNASYTDNIYKPIPRTYIESAIESFPIYGLPVYGTHHPNRSFFGLGGGACPGKGGDIGHYPWGNCGSGFPTNYEEITPICDGFLLDIKGWTNLWTDWWDPSLGLGNAGAGTLTLNYTFEPNNYGIFTDPYLLANNIINPYAVNWVPDWPTPVVAFDGDKPDLKTIEVVYDLIGTYLDYTPVPDLPPKGAWRVPTTENSPDPAPPELFGFRADTAGGVDEYIGTHGW